MFCKNCGRDITPSESKCPFCAAPSGFPAGMNGDSPIPAVSDAEQIIGTAAADALLTGSIVASNRSSRTNGVRNQAERYEAPTDENANVNVNNDYGNFEPENDSGSNFFDIENEQVDSYFDAADNAPADDDYGAVNNAADKESFAGGFQGADEYADEDNYEYDEDYVISDKPVRQASDHSARSYDVPQRDNYGRDGYSRDMGYDDLDDNYGRPLKHRVGDYVNSFDKKRILPIAAVAEAVIILILIIVLIARCGAGNGDAGIGTSSNSSDAMTSDITSSDDISNNGTGSFDITSFVYQPPSRSSETPTSTPSSRPSEPTTSELPSHPSEPSTSTPSSNTSTSETTNTSTPEPEPEE